MLKEPFLKIYRKKEYLSIRTEIQILENAAVMAENAFIRHKYDYRKHATSKFRLLY